MGFTIFTSSGTFNPVSYGLKVGDALHIVCVGGGGGGSTFANALSNGWDYSGNAGSAGGASSFGSYVTAGGGLGGTITKNSNSVSPNYNYEYMPSNSVEFSNQGGPGASGVVLGTYGSSYAAKYVYSAGAGGDGWLPGNFFTGTTNLTTAALVYDLYNPVENGNNNINLRPTIFPFRPIKYLYQTGINLNGEYTPQTGMRGGYGGNQGLASGNTGRFSFPGAPGVGYGAGGGGSLSQSYCGAGGSSGQIIHKDMSLTSTNSIAITVGAGGQGGYNSYMSSQNYLYLAGGGGNRGCVAVYW